MMIKKGSLIIYLLILLFDFSQNTKQNEIIKRDEETDRSFIRMDMASKDNINFVMNKPTLENNSHAFSLIEVLFITVVNWGVHNNN